MKKFTEIRHFNSDNFNWSINEEFNKVFIYHAFLHGDRKLEQRGYLFLNELYQMLGFPMTKRGQVAGWTYDKENMKQISWSISKVEEKNEFEIVLEPLENILDALPE